MHQGVIDKRELIVCNLTWTLGFYLSKATSKQFAQEKSVNQWFLTFLML